MTTLFAEAWFELERGEDRSRRFSMPLNKGSAQEGVLDFDQYQDLKKRRLEASSGRQSGVENFCGRSVLTSSVVRMLAAVIVSNLTL